MYRNSSRDDTLMRCETYQENKVRHTSAANFLSYSLTASTPHYHQKVQPALVTQPCALSALSAQNPLTPAGAQVLLFTRYVYMVLHTECSLQRDIYVNRLQAHASL